VHTDSGGACQFTACSESQVTSIGDASTNYCNTRMLLCGKADGCKPVKHQLTYSEKDVSPRPGSGSDKGACLAV
jgi:hypothetical protein